VTVGKSINNERHNEQTPCSSKKTLKQMKMVEDVMWIVMCLFSREANELRVPRYAVCANIVLFEAILHEDSSCLIKVDPPSLHDTHNLFLSRIVQSLSGVSSLDVTGQIKR
jgi:hypothetical protein